MQKFTQRFIQWMPFGTASVWTLHSVVQGIMQHEWTQALISSFVTACSTLWVHFSGKFMEELTEEAEKQGKTTAQILIRTVKNLPSNLSKLRSSLNFQKKYYQNLIYTYRTYQPQGLKTPGAFTPDLDKVFVPLRVASKGLEQISPAIIQQQESAGNLRIWDFLAESKTEPAYKRMVVIGAPGSGKTTLLKHLTLTYAQNTQRRWHRQAPKLIPVLLYLHKIRDRITSDKPPNLAELITQEIKNQELSLKLEPPPQWFEDKLQHGRCLVMLDGLDEVADEAQRVSVSRWVDSQMRKYPEMTLILTSRPFGYRKAPLQEVRISLGVQPFNLRQMEQFLHSWYLQNEVLRQARKEDPGVRAEAERKANDLVGRIKNYPPLAAMALNPLLLTMIATVHDNRGALPGNRVELYAEICDVLLVRRQEAKGVSEPLQLKAVQKQSVLQVLALELMQRETREFTLEEGKQIIQEPLVAVASHEVEPETFLKHIENVSGLFVEKDVGVYQFAHLSFQEYLAAAQVKEKNQEQLLIEKINSSWWHETIRLYAAGSDTTNLISAALEQPSVMSLTVAYDCLEEGKSVAPKVRQQLEEMSLESSDPEVASLAAQVKLARRLSKLLRIDESVQIDRGYVTCAEYQLFVDERLSLGERFQAGNARKPITGVSWENALEFCAWLSSKLQSSAVENVENGGLYYYRLPTSTEVQNHPAQEYRRLECWTLGESNLKEKGIRVVKERVPFQYTKLASYLAAGEWEKADQKTALIMFQMANREREGELDASSIETLPCSCLRIVDQLWLHYSNGRSGLGVQASIWESLGREPLEEYLPRLWWLESPGNAGAIAAALAQKFIACGIERSLLLFFETVTVNSQGQEIQREICQARYFSEDLGNGVTLEMVSIPGGTFLMGSPGGEGDDSERPQHEVVVQPFFMGKFQVTQAQWKAIASLPKVERDLKPKPSNFKGDKRPVEQVSWHDAVEFCARLSKKTGREYRLPSEAEWEYACRAGTTTPFHFGETITTDLANYRGTDDESLGWKGSYGSGPKGEDRKETTPVGSFPPNAFGLYDMHGNLWEWCADPRHDNYEGAPRDGSAWETGGDESERVLRGGSWYHRPGNCRSAYRDDNYPDYVNLNIGFRVVCVPARTLSP